MVLKGEIQKSGVEVIENVRVIDLVRDDHGRVCGVFALFGREAIFIGAGAIVLASGGAGRVFRHNVNPPSLEGDGWSMAYRAGARLVNMEFFQVGPAVFNASLTFIIHSHMWRLRPRLTNIFGEEVLPRHCPAGIDPAEVLDLKATSYPFSVRTDSKYLDIAIFKEVMAGRGTPSGGVWFDVTHVDTKTLRTQAFGYRAGRAAADCAANGKRKAVCPGRVSDVKYTHPSPEEEALLRMSSELYTSNLTIGRTEKGLREVLAFNDRHRRNANMIVINRLTVGSILVAAALTREESRGTHYREDYPDTSPAWRKRIVLSRSEGGTPRMEFPD